MNKKGFFSATTFLILIALMVGMIITTSNMEGDEFINKFKIALENSTSNITIQTPEQPEIGNAISYYLTGVIGAFKEMMIWITKFVVEHPEAPYKLLLYGLIISILAPIIILLFKLLIILSLLTKEYFQSRKEKKELNKFKKCQKKKKN